MSIQDGPSSEQLREIIIANGEDLLATYLQRERRKLIPKPNQFLELTFDEMVEKVNATIDKIDYNIVVVAPIMDDPVLTAEKIVLVFQNFFMYIKGLFASIEEQQTFNQAKSQIKTTLFRSLPSIMRQKSKTNPSPVYPSVSTLPDIISLTAGKLHKPTAKKSGYAEFDSFYAAKIEYQPANIQLNKPALTKIVASTEEHFPKPEAFDKYQQSISKSLDSFVKSINFRFLGIRTKIIAECLSMAKSFYSELLKMQKKVSPLKRR